MQLDNRSHRTIFCAKRIAWVSEASTTVSDASHNETHIVGFAARIIIDSPTIFNSVRSDGGAKRLQRGAAGMQILNFGLRYVSLPRQEGSFVLFQPRQCQPPREVKTVAAGEHTKQPVLLRRVVQDLVLHWLLSGSGSGSGSGRALPPALQANRTVPNRNRSRHSQVLRINE